jgi:ABC-type branched-subunit amino acid transport system ATPase component
MLLVLIRSTIYNQASIVSQVVRAGLALVIEGHRVFTRLAVLDSLLLAAYDPPRGEGAAHWRATRSCWRRQPARAGLLRRLGYSYLATARRPRLS